MGSKPQLTVVEGTGTSVPRYIDPGPSARYFETSVVNEHGHPYLREGVASEPGHGGGGGSMRLTLPDLRWNVALLNGMALLFTGALAGMFLWIIDRIDDKFEQLQVPVQETARAVAAQGATLQAMDKKLDSISDQNNERRQAPQLEPSPASKSGE